MQVDLVRRGAVNFGLGLGETAEDGGGGVLVGGRERRLSDDAEDIEESAGWLLIGDLYDGVRGGDSRPDDLIGS